MTHTPTDIAGLVAEAERSELRLRVIARGIGAGRAATKLLHNATPPEGTPLHCIDSGEVDVIVRDCYIAAESSKQLQAALRSQQEEIVALREKAEALRSHAARAYATVIDCENAPEEVNGNEWHHLRTFLVCLKDDAMHEMPPHMATNTALPEPAQ